MSGKGEMGRMFLQNEHLISIISHIDVYMYAYTHMQIYNISCMLCRSSSNFGDRSNLLVL